MPRINDQYLDCVIYLYPSVPMAEAGERLGGSGFLVGIAGQGMSHTYAVTNRHVVENGSTVIRLNTADGKLHALDLTGLDWTHDPEGDDLSIALLDFNEDELRLKVRSVPMHHFLTDVIISDFNIGPGDETFMVGRFYNHEGRQQNFPSARFGNISQMPNEPIRSGAQNQISFLVESRSLPGYSGSPVFVFIPPFSDRFIPLKDEIKARGGNQARISLGDKISLGAGPWFLGVDWAHINDYLPAKDDKGNDLPFRVRANSGMMAVVPAWRLHRFLMSEPMKQKRAKIEAERDSGAPAATPDSLSETSPPANDANPTHREDFTRLVSLAARKPEPKD
jgi:hypothetical protein